MSVVGEKAPSQKATAVGQATIQSYQPAAKPDTDIGLPVYRKDDNRHWIDQPIPLQVKKTISSPAAGCRVAIVHEWLDTYAGSERVLEQLLLCFPSADLFATVDFLSATDRQFLQGRRVQTSFVQRMPFARRYFRNYLGLMPLAIQQLDLTGYDLVISSNHAVAKGVLTGPDQLHVSYVHSPMRYVWDLQHQYLAQMGMERGLRSMYARWLFARLRTWDVATAHQVDHFIANSDYIMRRIRRTYRREATVIHPPVDVDCFSPGEAKDDFFLLACRFVPYKRAELVVESFARRRDRRLVVVGGGPEANRVRAAAQGATNIEFAGVVGRQALIDLMRRARAFVFAGEEDFGITLVEAQACGTPVVAYGRGGATDIVMTDEAERPTGLLFNRQDPDSINEALDRFERLEPRITSQECRKNALRFSAPRFRAELSAYVDQLIR